jgi:predicted nucleic acid-binding protein
MLNLDTHVLLYALAGELTTGEMEIDLENREFLQALTQVQVWPLDLDVCRAIRRLDFRGDAADEIIAATSLVHRVPLVTRDRRIRRSRRVPLARRS